MNRVAVIGAGLCGATAAAELVQSGYQVCVFDKGRAAGGRMSSKRTQMGYLDMGAQYFTARSDGFQRQVTAWLDAGCVALWPCSTASLTHEDGRSVLENSADHQLRYIGTPSMQAPVKAVLAGVPLITNCRIHSLQRQQGHWTLVTETGESYSGFSDVVLTAPPVQAEQLLLQSGLSELFIANGALLEPCWAVAMRTTAMAHAEAIFCQHPKLRFVSHQATKTGRSSCYILHFNAGFSRENVDQPAEFWFGQAADVLRADIGVKEAIEPVAAHRWLYASQNPDVKPPGIVSRPDDRLWLGGDWSFGGRVENAFLAGRELAASAMQYGIQR